MEKSFRFIVEIGYGSNVKMFVFENEKAEMGDLACASAMDFALKAAQTVMWESDNVVIKIEKVQEEEQK